LGAFLVEHLFWHFAIGSAQRQDTYDIRQCQVKLSRWRGGDGEISSLYRQYVQAIDFNCIYCDLMTDDENRGRTPPA